MPSVSEIVPAAVDGAHRVRPFLGQHAAGHDGGADVVARRHLQRAPDAAHRAVLAPGGCVGVEEAGPQQQGGDGILGKLIDAGGQVALEKLRPAPKLAQPVVKKPEPPKQNKALVWGGVGLGVALLVGLLIWGMSRGKKSA